MTQAGADAAGAASAAATNKKNNEQRLRYTHLDALLEAARLGEVTFLDGRFLIKWYEAGNGQVLRRQEMEPLGAFLPPEVLTQELADAGGLELFALSYCWASPEHPDPDGFHLARVVKVLKAYLAGRKPEEDLALEVSNLSNLGLEMAGYSFGAAKPDTSIGVFWDFLSLPQKPFLDDAEKNLFKRGLGSINAIYGHQRVTKLIMPELPPSASRRPYDESGWTRFELEVANLMSPPQRLVRLDGPFAKEHFQTDHDGEVPGDAWITMLLEGGRRIHRTGPRLPLDFAEDLQNLSFTNGADKSLVIEKYNESFANIVSRAESYSANSFGIATEAAHQLLQVLQHQCQELRSLNLGNNLKADLSLEIFAQHLCALQLQELDLSMCKKVHGGLAALAPLPHLRVLNLAKCEGVSGDLKDLAPLTQLQQLSLADCSQVSGDLAALAPLSKLQQLKLEDCSKVSGDLASLAALTELQLLDLFRLRQVSGDLASLSALAQLQSLDLLGCRQVAGDLAALAPLTKLEDLSLTSCSLVHGDVASLAPLTKLKKLRLAYCKEVTGNVADLAPLAELVELDVDGCRKIHGKLVQEGVNCHNYINNHPPAGTPASASSSCCCCM